MACMKGGGQKVGGKDIQSNKDTQRILDVCPATVAMPNPLLDPRAAQASETTGGGFGMA